MEEITMTLLPRCSAVRKDGTPCAYPAKDGKAVCGIHSRSQRHSVTKAIERRAADLRVYAKVASAAISVGTAAHAIATHWHEIVGVLSHFVNFAWEDNDRGMESTRKAADRLTSSALEVANAANRADLQRAAFGFESNADVFLFAATALNEPRTISGTEGDEIESVSQYYEAFVQAHRAFFEALKDADAELSADLHKFYPRYTLR
jgi:hypothetical protein